MHLFHLPEVLFSAAFSLSGYCFPHAKAPPSLTNLLLQLSRCSVALSGQSWSSVRFSTAHVVCVPFPQKHSPPELEKRALLLIFTPRWSSCASTDSTAPTSQCFQEHSSPRHACSPPHPEQPEGRARCSCPSGPGPYRNTSHRCI